MRRGTEGVSSTLAGASSALGRAGSGFKDAELKSSAMFSRCARAAHFPLRADTVSIVCSLFRPGRRSNSDSRREGPILRLVRFKGAVTGAQAKLVGGEEQQAAASAAELTAAPHGPDHIRAMAKFRQNVARFRLYRLRFLQENMRFAAFFKIYQILRG